MVRVVFRAADDELDTLFELGRLRRVWKARGESCLAALEQTAGLRFQHRRIVVRCGRFPYSHSGTPGREALRVSTHFSPDEHHPTGRRKDDDTILVLLMHELGRRLLDEHRITAPGRAGQPQHDYEAHRLLYLFLYDAIAQACGRQVAAAQKQLGRRDPLSSYARAD